MSAPEPRVMVLRCSGTVRPGTGRPARTRPGCLARTRAARLFEQVITAVTAFCPRVEAVEPGVCAFGARGPARYFGGETALAGQIIAAVARSACRPAPASPTGCSPPGWPPAPPDQPAPARAASRQPASPDPAGGCPVMVIPPGRTAEFLAGQPVSVLADQGAAGQALVTLLTRLGLRTLGDLAALPAGDVASRFGAAGETMHLLARGLGSRPLAVRPPAEDLSVAQEFDPPESLAEPVVFAAKALAERMHAVLAGPRADLRPDPGPGHLRGRAGERQALAARRAAVRGRRRRPGPLAARRLAGALRAPRARHAPGAPDGATTGPDDAADAADGGIAVLRLVPDQVVHATGHQLALWGETVVSDRVARAAMRVQALLGHEAVLRPVLGGGRDVAEQVNHVPFGEKMQPRLTAGAPWPGRVMGAAPGVVYPFAREADVTDDAGDAVTVTGRCVLSGTPAWLAADGEPPLRITGWAGPWPLSERWWDPAAARRRARFQLLTGDGRAWLAAVQGGRWLIEAGYW